MKNQLLLLGYLLLVLSKGYPQAGKLRLVDTFGNNPGNLSMLLYEPAINYQHTQQRPLVVVLHGCGQSARDVATLTNWKSIADSANCIILYPEQKFSNNIGRCFNWFNTGDIEAGKGECASIDQMIQYCIAHHCIDRNRVYITGFSAGAAMAVAMLVTRPQFFKAGAIFAGGAYKAATNPFAAMSLMAGNKKISREVLTKNAKEQAPAFSGTYPRILLFHGRNDAVVNFSNAEMLLTQWAGIYNSDTIADRCYVHYRQSGDITRTDYLDTSGNCFATLYAISNMGHKLAVSGCTRRIKSFFTADKHFDAVLECAVEFGIIEPMQEE